MKTSITLKRKSFLEQVTESFKELKFKGYCCFQTLLRHPDQFGKSYWSITDCYVVIGNSAYISNNQIHDLNGDSTPMKELVINESMKLFFSEPELSKIKKMADEKRISVKDLFMIALDKFQSTQ